LDTGGAVLIYDAIFKQNKFQHILVRHEQAAIHAADAYSRSSNKVGVAIVTSGPGVTNAVTGLSTAYMDSIPMVVISGQVPSHAIGQDAFQECDTVGITRPVVKHNFLVKDVKDLAATIKKAFFIAAPAVRDPCWWISQGYQHAHAIRLSEGSRDAFVRPVDKGHSGQIRKAVQLLLHERPMIYTGGGVILAHAPPELNKLVDRWVPVHQHLMGLGGYRASSSRCRHARHARARTMKRTWRCRLRRADRHRRRFDDRVIGNPAFRLATRARSST
jgi:acetolactate synthase-1/2/3 large subunit